MTDESDNTEPDLGPDLTQGVTLADFGDNNILRGHVGENAVLLVRNGADFHAVGASCTHYGGPLADGLVVGDTIRCPWHHACFSLTSGEAVGAPAFDPIACHAVIRSGDTIRVAPQPEAIPAAPAVTTAPKEIVIVGGGAAGFACAEMLRRRGYAGRLTMLSADADAPCDRPNLSKDYLAGEAPEEWIPLRGDDFYADNKIDLHLGAEVTAIDTKARTVTTADGQTFAYDRLLLATGAEPVHLPIPGADQPHVFSLRSLADSRAIITAATHAKSAVVLGSGFIGLETAAALRHRGLAVHVVSLDKQPLDRIMGVEVGRHIRRIHEQAGEIFHMENSIETIGAGNVTLKDGTTIAADLVIIGVGVRPRLALAQSAGLATDHGVTVNARLETSAPGVYAAGDIARWPGADGASLRVEHWVVAERHGQVAAENMLGAGKAYTDTPFFWSAHHAITIRYAGHAQGFDEVRIDGSLADDDCTIRYVQGGKVTAVATIGRDREALAFAAERAAGQLLP